MAKYHDDGKHSCRTLGRCINASEGVEPVQTASAPPSRWEDVLIIMRVFVILAWAGLAVGSLVKREAAAEAEAEADPSGYQQHRGLGDYGCELY